MRKAQSSMGYIESSRGINPDDFLVGAPPIVCDSSHSSPASCKKRLEVQQNLEEEDFDFIYPTIRDIKNPTSRSNESVRPHTARPTTTKYLKCHEADDVFSRAELMLQQYDNNNRRKKYIMHSEYEAEVAAPLQEKLREQLTGRNYRSRQASRLKSRKDVSPLRIETAGVGDRINRSRLEQKKEARLEKILSNMTGKKEPKRRELDPRRKADTRFFGYTQPPRKGTKVFDQKFKSSVLSQIDNFA